MAGLQKEFHALNKQLGAIGPVVQVSSYLGVSPLAAALLVTVAVFVSFMLFFNIGTGLIYTITGFAYPTYTTYRLVESKADATAMRGCMVYWAVFGVFTLCEGIIDAFLSWVPLYSIARVGFQVWLFTQNFAGAHLVYNTAVAPLFNRVDAVIDVVASELVFKAGDKPNSK